MFHSLKRTYGHTLSVRYTPIDRIGYLGEQRLRRLGKPGERRERHVQPALHQQEKAVPVLAGHPNLKAYDSRDDRGGRVDGLYVCVRVCRCVSFTLIVNRSDRCSQKFGDATSSKGGRFK